MEGTTKKVILPISIFIFAGFVAGFFLYTGVHNSLDKKLFAASLSDSVSSSGDCDDHVDNNGDGYCDFASKDGYCTDGSILGDPNCRSNTGSEVDCVPSPEICDGIDNNCNGQIDENLKQTQSCGLAVGECRQGTQTKICKMGQWKKWSNCAGAVWPKRELCGNGKDENCDGVSDDGCSKN